MVDRIKLTNFKTRCDILSETTTVHTCDPIFEEKTSSQILLTIRKQYLPVMQRPDKALGYPFNQNIKFKSPFLREKSFAGRKILRKIRLKLNTAAGLQRSIVPQRNEE